MLIARPALAVFSAVYRFMQSADRMCWQLWDSVRTELWTAIGLAPLLWTSLKTDWFEHVVASDASLDGLGVCAVRADATEVTVEELVAPDSHDWSVIAASPWKPNDEHINSLEIRASSTAIRWVLSHPHSIGRRLLLLSDSEVAVGCLSKGRSSSHRLLRRLRSISSLLLASRLQLSVWWIPSHLNPADEPSRRWSPLL